RAGDPAARRSAVRASLVPALALALAPIRVAGRHVVAASGEVGQLREEPLVDAGEVEARLALHPLPELRRQVGQEARIAVDRHQVEADVGLAPAGRPEPGRGRALRLARAVAG